jgi:hypothetical protein
VSPLSGFIVDRPTDGLFAAMSDQLNPGSHVLYQDVTVPSGGATLRFDLFIQTTAPTFFTPDTLDFLIVPNQQFRMDIVDPAVPVQFFDAGVLRNVYRTKLGDPTRSSYRTITASLDKFAGRTVRLRFAEVDNQGFFNVGIDNVVVAPRGPSSSIPPIVDHVLVIPRSSALPITGLNGDLLRLRLRDADGNGPWSLTIDWGDGVVNKPRVPIRGTLTFLRTRPLAPGNHVVAVTAVDAAGSIAPLRTFPLTVP